MTTINPTFASSGTSIFESMSRLATDTGAINLGQGFPEAFEPQELIEAAVTALRTGSHQYPPMMGLPALRKAVADNARRFLGLSVDWEREVLVTSGATEALADTFLALLQPGDEVILIEPVYDAYATLIRRAGGHVVPVRLSPPDWAIDPERLRAAVTNRTKLIVVNTPMNPIGKIFTVEERQLIADIAIEHDLVIVADEVYEHLVFDDRAFHTFFRARRHPRPCGAHRLGRQELLSDGLEGRLRDGRSPSAAADCPRPSICDVHHAAGITVGCRCWS